MNCNREQVGLRAMAQRAMALKAQRAKVDL